MTLSLTVGTNTYISLADAETYMEKVYDPDGLWAAATDAVKNNLLAQATIDIDSEHWRYAKTDDDQTLEFPRAGETTIETKVANACVEQALYRLRIGSEATARADLQAQGVTSFRLGDLSETYGGGGGSVELCGRVRRLMAEWWIAGAALA